MRQRAAAIVNHWFGLDPNVHERPAVVPDAIEETDTLRIA
jgi:hypothetical protein